VAGAVAALTVPMAALASLRVLDHASDRTQPPVALPDAEIVRPASPPVTTDSDQRHEQGGGVRLAAKVLPWNPVDGAINT
jgi:hypothetical protein